VNAAAPQPHQPPGNVAWYVYAVLDGEAVHEIPKRLGVLPEARLQTVTSGGLTALVSEVPLALFTAANGPAADATWIAACAERHHAVVTCIQAPSLPLGFGTMFASRAGLDAWLTHHSESARAALARLDCRAEWAVAMHEDEAAHAIWLHSNDSGLLALAEQQRCAGPGAAFLIGKRVARALAAARQAHLADMAARADADLRCCSPDVLAEQATTLTPSWSVLAEPGLPLSQRLHALAEKLRLTGLELRVTGPWPPYAFTRSFWQLVAS
jgi:hypothetical protein